MRTYLVGCECQPHVHGVRQARVNSGVVRTSCTTILCNVIRIFATVALHDTIQKVIKCDR